MKNSTNLIKSILVIMVCLLVNRADASEIKNNYNDLITSMSQDRNVKDVIKYSTKLIIINSIIKSYDNENAVPLNSDLSDIESVYNLSLQKMFVDYPEYSTASDDNKHIIMNKVVANNSQEVAMGLTCIQKSIAIFGACAGISGGVKFIEISACLTAAVVTDIELAAVTDGVITPVEVAGARSETRFCMWLANVADVRSNGKMCSAILVDELKDCFKNN